MPPPGAEQDRNNAQGREGQRLYGLQGVSSARIGGRRKEDDAGSNRLHTSIRPVEKIMERILTMVALFFDRWPGCDFRLDTNAGSSFRGLRRGSRGGGNSASCKASVRLTPASGSSLSHRSDRTSLGRR